MDKTRMSDIDMTAEMSKLNPSERHFVKKLEQMNTDRAKTMQVLRKRNKLFGAVIGATAIGICILFHFNFS
jgi:Coiled-coil domain-containing protein 56